MQLHLVSAREVGHQKESAPRPGGKPTIGLDLRLRMRGSRRVEFRHHHRPHRFLDSLGLRVEQRTLAPSPQIHSSLSRNVQRPESDDVPSMRPSPPATPTQYYTQKRLRKGAHFVLGERRGIRLNPYHHIGNALCSRNRRFGPQISRPGACHDVLSVFWRS